MGGSIRSRSKSTAEKLKDRIVSGWLMRVNKINMKTRWVTAQAAKIVHLPRKS